MPLLKIAFCNRYPNCSRGQEKLLFRIRGIDELFATCGSKEIMEKLKEHKDMHYIFLDDELEEVNILAFIELLRMHYANLKIVVMTPQKDIAYLKLLHGAGACGLIHKSFKGPELRLCILQLEATDYYLCPVLTPIFFYGEELPPKRNEPLKKLNFKNRQLKILACLQERMSYNEIAERLGVKYDYIRKEGGGIKRALRAKGMLHILG